MKARIAPLPLGGGAHRPRARWILVMLALVAALAVPGKAQVPAVVTQFDVTGFIQQATIDRWWLTRDS